MLKSVEWREGDVYSFRLAEDLYTLVQMRKNYIMQFFDVSSTTDCWDHTDLNDYETIFFHFVAPKGLRRLFSEKISSDKFAVSAMPVERRLLSLDFLSGPGWSVHLVEMPENFDSVNTKIIKRNLNIEEDIDLIYNYELGGVEGNAERLSDRLRRYFKTGVNWDDSKAAIFKGISPPSDNFCLGKKKY